MSLTRRDDNVPQSDTGLCLLSIKRLEETPRANVSPAADTIASTKDPEQPADQRCRCQYLWMHEIHGVPAIMMSYSLEEKLLWALILAICGLVAFYNTKTMLGNYVQQRSATKITIVPVKSMEFPAFIFCSKNADVLNYTALQNGNFFLNSFTKAELTRLYNVWRGNKSVLEMFDFVFNENGFTCEEFFHTCWLGPLTLDCCDIFVPTFALLRGRCFRLAVGQNQTNSDEAGKLVVFLKQLKGRLAGKKNTGELIMYIGDTHPEIGTSPRFYLSPNTWNRFRITQKRFSFLPNNPECSTRLIDQGIGTCYVYEFLHKVLIGPLNCTFPYYKEMLPYLNSTPVCDPLIILQDYARITNTIIESDCVAACERVENAWDWRTSSDLSKNKKHSFRVEASFTDLEVFICILNLD
ncbi:unnamed protein product [Cylicocyclus nassatus]|uniref:Uncharacterized protein n=1 Tax=Cylicocyclus nassatus TaxID=53992 RepID=A0AA36GZR9_CYLNA|nr:unnamed protein product [Cylicocyclus nassatus]